MRKLWYRWTICLLYGWLGTVSAVAQTDTTEIQQLLSVAERSPENSLGLYQTAYDLSRQLNYRPGLQRSLAGLGKLAMKSKNAPIALRYLLEELEVLEIIPDPERLRQVHTSIGDIYRQEGLYQSALPYYQQALEVGTVPQALQDSLYLRIGALHAALRQPDSTQHYLSRLTVWSDQSRRGKEAQLGLLHQLVQAYSRAGAYEKALPFNQQILERMTSEGRSARQMAVIYNNLGYNYNHLADYAAAVSHFEKALDHTPADDHEQRAVLHTNAGIAHFNLGNFERALDDLRAAKKHYQTLGEVERRSIDHLLSNVYLNSGDLYNARIFNQTTIRQARRHGLFSLLSEAYYTAARIHAELYEYETALSFYQQYFNLRDSLQNIEQQRQSALRQEQLALEKAERDIRNLLINQEIQDLTIQQLTLEREKQQLALDNLALTTDQQEQQLQLLKRQQEVDSALIKNQELAAQQAQQALELARQRLLAEQQERELSELTQQERLRELELQRKEAQLAREAQENELLRKDNDIQQLELTKERGFRRFAYGLGILFLIILGLILAGLLYSRYKNRQLVEERNKSDALLLNILPEATARELKEKGVAQPRRYEDATVLFTDFVDFTTVAAEMAPEELVNELNLCFREFDNIVEKYGLEKIKTIGDAYMCVGGLPDSDPFHPQHAAQAAIEMMNFIQERYKEKRQQGLPYWQMRIGMHTGPVVAGVVGRKKFVFDVWGDTVNTASRIESNSNPGKINVSDTTFRLIQRDFRLRPRGKVDAKNKGEMEMYFLETA